MDLTCLSDKKLGHSTRFEKVSSVSGLTAHVFRYFHRNMSTCELVQSVRPLLFLVYFGRHVQIASKTSFWHFPQVHECLHCGSKRPQRVYLFVFASNAEYGALCVTSCRQPTGIAPSSRRIVQSSAAQCPHRPSRHQAPHRYHKRSQGAAREFWAAATGWNFQKSMVQKY